MVTSGVMGVSSVGGVGSFSPPINGTQLGMELQPARMAAANVAAQMDALRAPDRQA